MACDLWLVPLVDVLCHTPDNPFAEELAQYNTALAENGLPPVPVYQYMPGLSGEVAPVGRLRLRRTALPAPRLPAPGVAGCR